MSQAFPPWSHAAPWGLRLVTGQTEPQSKSGILGWAGLRVGGSAGQRVGTVMSPLLLTLAKARANGCRPRGTATGQEAETLNQRLPPDWLPYLGAPSQLPQFSSVTQLCPTLCDPMDCSTPGFPVHDQFPELTQTHIHRVGDAIQPSHPLPRPLLLPPSFPASGSFSTSRFFVSGGQSIGVLASGSVLPMNIQD